MLKGRRSMVWNELFFRQDKFLTSGQLPATKVASLRESFDTSICLDRPGLLHSQSCEVQQRSGNYQSH